jgi:hypothetical protein
LREAGIQTLWPFLERNAFFGDDLLRGDVIEGVKDEVSTVLQGLPVLDLRSRSLPPFLEDFAFAKLDFLLPAGGTVEFLIVLAEVEAAVVEAFVEVLRGHFLTGLLELGPASR